MDNSLVFFLHHQATIDNTKSNIVGIVRNRR
jgi:hypothetical protein